MKLIFSEGRPVRPGPQQEALDALAKLDKKYVLLSAPVGSGKSEIGMAAVRGAETAFIVTPQNILLDQYVRDFGLPVVKGRKKYDCRWARMNRKSGMNCRVASELYGAEHSKKCEDYMPARDAFWRSQISATNLHFACLARRPDDVLCPRSLLVIDECHALEPTLLRLYEITLLRADVLKLGVNYRREVPDVLRDFLTQCEVMNSDLANRLVPDLNQQERINSVARRIEPISLCDTSNPWSIKKDDHGISLRPLFARNLAQKLLGIADRFLFMSATPGTPEHFFRNLGIPAEETAFVEVDSNFERGKGIRLVRSSHSVKTERIQAQLPMLVRQISQVLRQLPNERGLIACASYGLAYALAERLAPEFGARIITHSKDTREAIVEQHCQGAAPTILLGVNMHEGLDLAEDLARFLIVPKVLFPAMDAWTKDRDKLDPGYYGRLTCQRMIQVCGRVVRGPEDWAHIFILDSNIKNLLRDYHDEFPEYFHRGFRVA